MVGDDAGRLPIRHGNHMEEPFRHCNAATAGLRGVDLMFTRAGSR